MKKIFILFLIIFFIAFLYFTISIGLYVYNKKSNKDYNQMIDLLLSKVLMNNIEIKNHENKWIRLDTNPRIVEEKAINESELLIGYGLLFDADFEEAYSSYTHKPVYIFDCGVKSFNFRNPEIYFYQECIATDKFLLKEYNQISSQNIHSYAQMLKRFGLENKKVFIKMDIAGAEIDALPGVLEYSDNITGMVINFRIDDVQNIIDLMPILDEINKKFILVHRNPYSFPGFEEFSYNESIIIKSKYYFGEYSDYSLVLSYINKNLIDKNSISLNQDSAKYKETYIFKNDRLEFIGPDSKYNIVKKDNINIIVTITEKLWNLIHKE